VSAESITAEARAGVDWRRAEFVLTILAFLGFLTLPIRITTIYSGLPAHPLFVHVPVVLIPATIVAAIACTVKPAWLSRYGIALAVVSIAAMSSVFLTMQAGAALRAQLNLQGPAANLISQHSGCLGVRSAMVRATRSRPGSGRWSRRLERRLADRCRIQPDRTDLDAPCHSQGKPAVCRNY
jgi:hypothetical protein